MDLVLMEMHNMATGVGMDNNINRVEEFQQKSHPNQNYRLCQPNHQ